MYLSCDLALDIGAQVLTAVAESIRIEYIPLEIFLAGETPQTSLITKRKEKKRESG